MSREAAHDLLQRCAAAGIGEYCLCAGARNVELVVPLSESDAVKTWHFFEERCAAFFAVGRMMRTRKPVAVVTTSGTAAAELLPAIIEAHYQRLPFVAITADRPEEFRHSGAPQAIEQEKLYGDYAETDLDRWAQLGPLHLNVCQDEPKPGASAVPLQLGDWSSPPLDMDSCADFFSDRAGLIVMLGAIPEADRSDVLVFLLELGAPVYAEAPSGMRESPELAGLRLGELDLKTHETRKVVRVGGVPACRFWRDLETRTDIEVLSITDTLYRGLAREAQVVPMTGLPAVEGGTAEQHSPGEDHVKPFCERFPRSECAFVRGLSETIPGGASVFLGNSLPIREWNLAATYEDRGLDVFAARGANGIDGQVSSFFGMSEGVNESWLVCGDLTAMYDLSAPWIAPQLTPGKRRIVVVNNGGGRIFSRLPAMRNLGDNARNVIENVHDSSFESWAAMWGWDYIVIRDREELAQPVKSANAVIEIVPDSTQSQAFWGALP